MSRVKLDGLQCLGIIDLAPAGMNEADRGMMEGIEEKLNITTQTYKEMGHNGMGVDPELARKVTREIEITPQESIFLKGLVDKASKAEKITKGMYPACKLIRGLGTDA